MFPSGPRLGAGFEISRLDVDRRGSAGDALVLDIGQAGGRAGHDCRAARIVEAARARRDHHTGRGSRDNQAGMDFRHYHLLYSPSLITWTHENSIRALNLSRP